MKTLLWAPAGVLVLAAGVASADPGFAVGASVGYAKIEDSESGFNFDETDLGFKAFGSYTFANGIGIEGGYVDFGEPQADILDSSIEIDATGWTLYGVGNLPVGDSVDLFAKAGAVRWDADSIVNGIRVDDDSGTDLALGIGGSWQLGETFGLRSEFDWYNVSEADSVWMLSVGLEVRF